MRKSWAYKTIDWDDLISEALQKEWESFFKECILLKYLNFPRSIKAEDTVGQPDLVIFLDGSKDAYATVSYARWKKADDNYESRFLTSKNHVAPIKVADILRLELPGALISKRLKSTIEAETRMSFNMVCHIVSIEIVKIMINQEV